MILYPKGGPDRWACVDDDRQPMSLREWIETKLNHARNFCAATIEIRGRGSSSPIPWYPGLWLKGNGTASGVSEIVQIDRTKHLIGFPDNLENGGGGTGKNYPHHSRLSDLRLVGTDHDYGSCAAIRGYNGGFLNKVENIFVRGFAAGFQQDQTAQNVSVTDLHCTKTSHPLVLDFDGNTQAHFSLRGDMQWDGCGASLVKLRNKGGLQEALTTIEIGGVKLEWTNENWPSTKKLPRAAFEIEAHTKVRHQIHINRISATHWIEAGGMASVVRESGLGYAQEFFGLETIQRRKVQHPARPEAIEYDFISDITGQTTG